MKMNDAMMVLKRWKTVSTVEHAHIISRKENFVNFNNYCIIIIICFYYDYYCSR